MSKISKFQQSEIGKSLYLLPFCVFALLMLMRNTGDYTHLFELLPVLGRTIPYFSLSILLVCVFIFRGGSLAQLGLCWPIIDKSKLATIRWILFSALIILAMRILVAVALGPLMELLPPRVTRNSPLEDNLSLLVTLLPMMWLVVIGEELLIRGLLIRFLTRIFGDTTKGWLLAILISAIVFGLGHYGKGSAAMLSSGLGGVVYGLGYFLFRKNLWPVIIAHCSANTIGFIGGYFGD